MYELITSVTDLRVGDTILMLDDPTSSEWEPGGFQSPHYEVTEVGMGCADFRSDIFGALVCPLHAGGGRWHEEHLWDLDDGINRNCGMGGDWPVTVLRLDRVAAIEMARRHPRSS